MSVLGYLSKLKLASIYNLFSSQDVKKNVLWVLILTTDEVINFKLYLQSLYKAMPKREKEKKGRKNFEFLKTEEQLFRLNKKHFS